MARPTLMLRARLTVIRIACTLFAAVPAGAANQVTQNGGSSCKAYLSGKQTSVRFKADFPSKVALSPDGQFAYACTGQGQLVTRDLKTGKLDTQLLDEKPEASAFAATAQKLLTVSDSGNLNLTDLKSKSTLNLPLPPSLLGKFVEGAAITPDAKTAVIMRADRTIVTYDVEKKKILKILPAVDLSSSDFEISPDGARAVLRQSNGITEIVDLASGKHKLISASSGNGDFRGDFGSTVSVAFGADSKTLVMVDKSGAIVSQDLTSDAKVTVDSLGPVSSAKLTDGGRSLSYVGADGKLRFRDLATQKTTELFDSQNAIGAAYNPEHSVLVTISDYGALTTTELSSVCAKNDLRIESDLAPKDTGSCEEDSNALYKSLSAEWFKKFNAKSICSQPYDAKSWDPIAPYPPTEPITREGAENYLMRFQKPRWLRSAKTLTHAAGDPRHRPHRQTPDACQQCSAKRTCDVTTALRGFAQKVSETRKHAPFGKRSQQLPYFSRRKTAQ